MLAEHLGVVQEVDPKFASVEASIVRALQKHGPMRQKDLWYRCAGVRIGREAYQQLIDALVERRVIVRQTTNRINSFILRMASDKRKRERAIVRETRGQGA